MVPEIFVGNCFHSDRQTDRQREREREREREIWLNIMINTYEFVINNARARGITTAF